jgi:hypothetical protein
MIISRINSRPVLLILLTAMATGPVGCGERKTSAPKEKWQQVEVREYSADELGQRQLRLRAAVIDSISPLRAKRKQLDSDLRHSDYELVDIKYYGGRINDDVFLVAVGGFLETGVARVEELDAQVTAITWHDRVSVIDVAEGFLGLGVVEPIRLWRFGKREMLRVLIIEQGSAHQFTTSTSVTVRDYDLKTGECTDLLYIGSSEHDSRTPINLDIATGERMTITATHPDDGKDNWANVEAGSYSAGVLIEQLRRASVRVSFPGPVTTAHSHVAPPAATTDLETISR